jgi:hypothetical protein
MYSVSLDAGVGTISLSPPQQERERRGGQKKGRKGKTNLEKKIQGRVF